MELLDKLPHEIVRKIFLYLSHPCADMIKQEVENMSWNVGASKKFAKSYFIERNGRFYYFSGNDGLTYYCYMSRFYDDENAPNP